MKLDDTAKIVSMVSIAVLTQMSTGQFLSGAVYFIGEVVVLIVGLDGGIKAVQ